MVAIERKVKCESGDDVCIVNLRTLVYLGLVSGSTSSA